MEYSRVTDTVRRSIASKTKIVDFEVTMTLHNKNKRVMLLNAREILAEKGREPDLTGY